MVKNFNNTLEQQYLDWGRAAYRKVPNFEPPTPPVDFRHYARLVMRRLWKDVRTLPQRTLGATLIPLGLKVRLI